jgi:hypothetical protein
MEPDPNRQNAVCVTRSKPDSTQMVFLYLGVQGRLFLRPLDFIRLSGAATRNLSMFRDFSNSYFHGYIDSQWTGFDAALRNQRELLNTCPKVTELFCSGTSTGAYAAILFGHYLGAEQVHAFAPKTLIDVERFCRGVEVPAQHRDLSLLLENWNGKTQYFIYYSRDHRHDSGEANRLAACPAVELRPMPGSHHNVMLEIDTEEVLGNLFPPAAAL